MNIIWKHKDMRYTVKTMRIIMANIMFRIFVFICVECFILLLKRHLFKKMRKLLTFFGRNVRMFLLHYFDLVYINDFMSK